MDQKRAQKTMTLEEMRSQAKAREAKQRKDLREIQRRKSGDNVTPIAAAARRAKSDDMRETWLPVHIVAKRLNISRRRAYTLIYEGAIEAVNFGQRLWRVAESELVRYMAQCRQKTLEQLGHQDGVISGRADRNKRRR